MYPAPFIFSSHGPGGCPNTPPRAKHLRISRSIFLIFFSAFGKFHLHLQNGVMVGQDPKMADICVISLLQAAWNEMARNWQVNVILNGFRTLEFLEEALETGFSASTSVGGRVNWTNMSQRAGLKLKHANSITQYFWPNFSRSKCCNPEFRWIKGICRWFDDFPPRSRLIAPKIDKCQVSQWQHLLLKLIGFHVWVPC